MVAHIPNDIFQFSTIAALGSGNLTTTGPPVARLSGYGTHGLGTFENLNGEMLLLDGKAWQMIAIPRPDSTSSSNGSDDPSDKDAQGKLPIIRPAPPHLSLPFVQVTQFIPTHSLSLPAPPGQPIKMPHPLTKTNFLSVMTSIADYVDEHPGGKNSFLPFVVKGVFSKLTIRIGGPKLSQDDTLEAVVARAPKWTLTNAKGTIFGIMSPAWTAGISVPGFHGHFIGDETEDVQFEGKARGEEVRQGGHVLDFETTNKVEVQWAVTGRYHLGFGGGGEWEGADMMGGSKDE